MTGWVVHSLGGISLLFTDVASSTYLVEDIANPPEEKINEEYVDLGDGAGARLSAFSISEAPHTLDVICLGSDQAAADAARQALQAKIDLAIGGVDVSYEYQLDPSQPEPSSWKVVGGRVRERWLDSENVHLIGLAGRYVACAKVYLTLSKN